MTTPDFATRRSFIQATGAALSVPLAAAATVPVSAADQGDPLSARLAHLEDLEAIRALNQEYARHVNAGARAELAALFVDPSNATLAPGVRGLAPDGFGEHDAIEVAADRQTATARLHYTAQIERAIEPDCPLVEMARQQGGGVVRRIERGVVEHVYVRREGIWKIHRTAYRAIDI